MLGKVGSAGALPALGSIGGGIFSMDAPNLDLIHSGKV
jgi:hypothetical protein